MVYHLHQHTIIANSLILARLKSGACSDSCVYEKRNRHRPRKPTLLETNSSSNFMGKRRSLFSVSSAPRP